MLQINVFKECIFKNLVLNTSHLKINQTFKKLIYKHDYIDCFCVFIIHILKPIKIDKYEYSCFSLFVNS